MAIELRWVDASEHDKVAQTRHRCYGSAMKNAGQFRESMSNDPRARAGDFLLAEEKGQPIGTITSLSLNIRLGEAKLPCQGIAWVGTAKTSRRTGDKSQPGIATQLMNCALDKAREREQPVSALMPFRASFYEHFGFGLAEKRVEWSIPLGILPKAAAPGFRFFSSDDLPQLMAARQAEFSRGQADIETDLPTLRMWAGLFDNGWCMVYQPAGAAAPLGYLFFVEESVENRKVVRVEDWCCFEPSNLLPMLAFLGTLQDQYSSVFITLPADVPLNLLLKESQIPHRAVDHPFPVARPYTRMQIRVLDHRKALEAMRYPAGVAGKATIAVAECEGTTSQFQLEIADGRASVSAGKASPDFACPDRIWSSIVGGHLQASQAMIWGLAEAKASAAALLDAFSQGPQPFCQDYF